MTTLLSTAHRQSSPQAACQHIALVVFYSLALVGYERLQHGKYEEGQKATPALGAAGFTRQWVDSISVVTASVEFDQSEGCVGA